MTIPAQAVCRRKFNRTLSSAPFQKFQHGVVLIIALVILVVISLLAVSSMRNAGSSEAVAGNVRTIELATEAAEMALRHCEASVLKILGGNDAYTTTFVAANILDTGTPTQWQLPASWDKTNPVIFVLPLNLINQSNMRTTYKRPPECMVEKIPSVTEGTSVFYVVTVRGFGPEVAAADTNRTRPVGSEIWLQSHIEIQ